MNVPPLITAAVSATANAPSERLPRKYLRRNPAFRLATRLATTPRPSETSVKSTSAPIIAGCVSGISGLAMVLLSRLADVGIELGRVVAAEVVLGHREPGEPDGEHAAD